MGFGSHLEVDGVLRPTTNSEGRLIHPTETGIRNFWRWFGDSKVVDIDGRPQVNYHGTHADFRTFVTERAGRMGRSAGNVAGAFFSPDPALASRYAQGDGGRVGAWYLKIVNPAPDREIVIATYGRRGRAPTRPPERIRQKLVDQGFDGAYRDGHWISFFSEQIESAMEARWPGVHAQSRADVSGLTVDRDEALAMRPGGP